MDNKEAKFILKAYRPNGADAGDAQFCEALEQAKRDPELGAWFEREQRLDQAVAVKMRALTPPVGLRAAILAGGKMSARPRVSWWTQPRWMALAASLALLIAVGLGLPRIAAAREARRFGEFALNDVLFAPEHAAHGPGMGQLAALVSDARRRLGEGVPIEFEALRANGCRTLRFAGHDVLEVCFERGGKEFHFYAMKRPEKFGMREGADGLLFAKADGGAASAVVWSDARFVYAVAGAEGPEALKALL